MKKLILTATAVAALAPAGLATTLASAASPGPIGPTDGVEGCVIVGVDGPGGGTCSYSPTSPGGFVGQGNFTLKLYSPQTVGGTTQEVLVATLTASDQQGCAQWSPSSSGGKYNNINLVVGTVADDQSGVAFGDPFPAQAQGTGSGQTACGGSSLP